jgi:hypothetical protein
MRQNLEKKKPSVLLPFIYIFFCLLYFARVLQRSREVRIFPLLFIRFNSAHDTRTERERREEHQAKQAKL